jgi:hypothetical protein
MHAHICWFDTYTEIGRRAAILCGALPCKKRLSNRAFFYETVSSLLMHACPAQMLPPSQVSLTSPGYWLSSAMHAPRSMAPVTVTSSIGSGLSLPAPEYCTRVSWEMQAPYTQANAGCRLHNHSQTAGSGCR